MSEECQLVVTLRAAIVNSGLSHYRIAKDAGITADVVSRFVSGERQLRIESAGRIAQVLGLELLPQKRKTKKV
jgi:plasmid maintenance system antidote protein VapI